MNKYINKVIVQSALQQNQNTNPVLIIEDLVQVETMRQEGFLSVIPDKLMYDDSTNMDIVIAYSTHPNKISNTYQMPILSISKEEDNTTDILERINTFSKEHKQILYKAFFYIENSNKDPFLVQKKLNKMGAETVQFLPYFYTNSQKNLGTDAEENYQEFLQDIKTTYLHGE